MTSEKLFDLSDRTALITGAGQGMGFGVAEALCRQGANVVVNDLFEDRANDAVIKLKQAGGKVIAAPGDITAKGAAEDLLRQTEKAFGELDILVNNAGVPVNMPASLRQLDELEDEDFDTQLALNFHAVVSLCRAVLPGMKKRNHGRIVVISSESWRLGQSMGLTNYASAKAASIGFARNLAQEVGRSGVTINVLSLGAMNNFGYDEHAAKITAVGRAGTPDDVGAAVAYLVSDEASWMTGQTIPLNGGSCTA